MQSNRYGGTDRTAVGVARGIFATFALLGAAASTLWGLLANTDPATAQLGKMALLIAGILWAYLIYLAIASRKKY